MNNNYQSFWFSHYTWVYFLRDADGKIHESDWRISKAQWRAEFLIRDNELPLPAELVRRTQYGAEVLVEEYYIKDGIPMKRVHLVECDDDYGQQHIPDTPKSDPSLN